MEFNYENYTITLREKNLHEDYIWEENKNEIIIIDIINNDTYSKYHINIDNNFSETDFTGKKYIHNLYNLNEILKSSFKIEDNLSFILTDLNDYLELKIISSHKFLRYELIFKIYNEEETEVKMLEKKILMLKDEIKTREDYYTKTLENIREEMNGKIQYYTKTLKELTNTGRNPELDYILNNSSYFQNLGNNNYALAFNTSYYNFYYENNLLKYIQEFYPWIKINYNLYGFIFSFSGILNTQSGNNYVNIIDSVQYIYNFLLKNYNEEVKEFVEKNLTTFRTWIEAEKKITVVGMSKSKILEWFNTALRKDFDIYLM